MNLLWKIYLKLTGRWLTVLLIVNRAYAILGADIFYLTEEEQHQRVVYSARRIVRLRYPEFSRYESLVIRELGKRLTEKIEDRHH